MMLGWQYIVEVSRDAELGKTLGVKSTKSAQMQGRLLLLTFLGEARKVSAARH